MFILALAIGAAIVFTGGGEFGVKTVEPSSEIPDQETNVTCYKWVENGTARVLCPQWVYAPNSRVNITVKPCSEYRYRIDEARPCNRTTKDGKVNLTELPVRPDQDERRKVVVFDERSYCDSRNQSGAP